MRTLKLLIALILGASPAFSAALTANCAWSVIAGGSANNGAMFDPSQTAGMATDLTSTSSSSTTPSFASASYNFTVADEGNWVFIGGGGGWQTGYYKIIGNSVNSAVMDAAIGHVILYNTTTGVYSLSTVAGCGATTGGTWAVNYSGPGQTAASFTDSTFTGAGTAVISNTSNVFTQAMVGNAIHLTAGTGATVGWYTITAYTSTTAVAVNVSPGTGTLWTGYVGGGAADIANINSATAGLGPVAGNNVWFKGTFSETSTTITGAFSGSSTAPIALRGYATYWTDGYQGRTNGNGALSTSNMAAMTFTSGRLTLGGVSWLIVDSFDFTGTSNTTSSMVQLGVDSIIIHCALNESNTTSTTIALSFGSAHTFGNDCDVAMTGVTGATQGVAISGSGDVRVKAFRIIQDSTNAAAYGIADGDTAVSIIHGNQIIGAGFATPSGIGIFVSSSTGTPDIEANTIVGFVDDINIVTGSSNLNWFDNNMVTDSSGYGINGVIASNALVTSNNRYRNNTSGTVNLATSWTNATNYSAVTNGASTDYVSVTSNLQLLPASPAINAGLPKLASIGALQPSGLGGATTSGSSY